jgi:hypothetical protein
MSSFLSQVSTAGEDCDIAMEHEKVEKITHFSKQLEAFLIFGGRKS